VTADPNTGHAQSVERLSLTPTDIDDLRPAPLKP